MLFFYNLRQGASPVGNLAALLTASKDRRTTNEKAIWKIRIKNQLLKEQQVEWLECIILVVVLFSQQIFLYLCKKIGCLKEIIV
jgi:hypothetical protein